VNVSLILSDIKHEEDLEDLELPLIFIIDCGMQNKQNTDYSFLTFFICFCILYFCSYYKSYSQNIDIYESYVVLNINGGGNNYYDLEANTPLFDFNNTFLGTFTPGINSIVFVGGQNKTTKCNGGNVTGGNIYYRIHLKSCSGGSFSSLPLGFKSDDVGAPCLGQNQTWETLNGTNNIIAGLTAGTYVLEIYTDATGSPGTVFSSNSGNNFKAEFGISFPYGAYASAVYIEKNNNGQSLFYNTLISCGPNDIDGSRIYEGTNLGTFKANSLDLRLTGAELKSFEQSGFDVCKVKMCYLVYLEGARPATPTFTCLDIYEYQKCCLDSLSQSGCLAVSPDDFPNTSNGSCSTGDRKWQSPGNPNPAFPVLLTGYPLGKKVLEVYYEIHGYPTGGNCNAPTIYYDNNNLSNYKATFEIVEILPFEKIQLNIEKKQHKIILNWKVNENESYFQHIVEYSTNGVNFNNIGKVDKSQISSEGNYFYSCSQLSNGIGYYRIKSLRNDGAFIYSNIKSLVVYNTQKLVSFSSLSDHMIQLNASNDIMISRISISNLSGQFMKHFYKMPSMKQIDISWLPAGFYILHVATDKGVVNLPFVKQ
jgi:hypothetical protein